MIAPNTQPPLPSSEWVRLDCLLALISSGAHTALLDKLTEAVRAGELKVYRDRVAKKEPKEMPARLLQLPARFLSPGFIGIPGTATQPMTMVQGIYPIFQVKDLRAIWRSLVERPSQELINGWVLKQYQYARDNGQPPPKRDSILHDCRMTRGATDQQAREAIRLVPKDLKRRVGQRDHSSGGRSGVRSGAPN